MTASHYLTPQNHHDDYIPERSQAYIQLLDSPFHIYESVDTPCKVGLRHLEQGVWQPVVFQDKGYRQNAFLRNNQLYETIKVRENSCLDEVRRANPNNLYESFSQTPQRTKNSKCFRRPLPLPLSGLETYHGVPQPEPPSVSISGLGSESFLGEDDTTSLAIE